MSVPRPYMRDSVWHEHDGMSASIYDTNMLLFGFFLLLLSSSFALLSYAFDWLDGWDPFDGWLCTAYTLQLHLSWSNSRIANACNKTFTMTNSPASNWTDFIFFLLSLARPSYFSNSVESGKRRTKFVGWCCCSNAIYALGVYFLLLFRVDTRRAHRLWFAHIWYSLIFFFFLLYYYSPFVCQWCKWWAWISREGA